MHSIAQTLKCQDLNVEDLNVGTEDLNVGLRVNPLDLNV